MRFWWIAWLAFLVSVSEHVVSLLFFDVHTHVVTLSQTIVQASPKCCTQTSKTDSFSVIRQVVQKHKETIHTLIIIYLGISGYTKLLV